MSSSCTPPLEVVEPWAHPAGRCDLSEAPLEMKRVRLARAVTLMKEEVFDACCALALAERELMTLGRPMEAASLATLFDVLEARLATGQA